MLPSVQADLVNIFEYIARESGSLVIGRRFVEGLRQKCRDLSSLPATIGRARPDLRPDVRSFAFRGYVIFFRYNGDWFEVANIIEGHRDINAFWSEDGEGRQE